MDTEVSEEHAASIFMANMQQGAQVLPERSTRKDTYVLCPHIPHAQFPTAWTRYSPPLTSNGPSFQTAHITYHVHTLVPSTLKMDKACFSNMLVYHSLNSNRQKKPEYSHFASYLLNKKKNVHTKYIREFHQILLFKKG